MLAPTMSHNSSYSVNFFNQQNENTVCLSILWTVTMVTIDMLTIDLLCFE